MSDIPFIGELKLFGFDRIPRGWAPCNGQTLPITQNQALFSLLGTTYGGDGRTTFALPDLRGRVPLHRSPSRPIGVSGGAETHTLAPDELPSHSHGRVATGAPGTASVAGGNLLAVGNLPAHRPPDAEAPVNMADSAVGPAGGGQPHDNRQPYTVLSWCIALQGAFPSRN